VEGQQSALSPAGCSAGIAETAQHYWEVDARLRQSEAIDPPRSTTIAQFIPCCIVAPSPRTLTLSVPSVQPVELLPWQQSSNTLRSSVPSVAILAGCRFTALAQWWCRHAIRCLVVSTGQFGRPWTAEDAINADQQRLQRILRDCWGAWETVYLCHSDLAEWAGANRSPVVFGQCFQFL